jgi:hypothetical protein
VNVPGEALLAARSARFLGLVGVDHDLHAVADGVADRFDLGNVLLQRRAVQAEFYGPVPRVEQAQGVFGPALRGADLDQAGVRAHAVGVRTPERVEWEPGCLADEIPQCELDATGNRQARPGWARVAQHPYQSADRQGILTDQSWRDGVRDKRGRAMARTDAGLTGIGADEVDGRYGLAPDPPRRPGRTHLAGEGSASHLGFDRGDFHRRIHGRPAGAAISIVFVHSIRSADGSAVIVPIAPR